MKRSDAFTEVMKVLCEVTYPEVAKKRAEKIVKYFEQNMIPKPYLHVDGDLGTEFREGWEPE